MTRGMFDGASRSAQGWILSFGPTTARMRPTQMCPPSRLEAVHSACCSVRGVIRVGIPVPPDAEFDLVAVDAPYGYASATELSLFRRPLPSTNLRLLIL